VARLWRLAARARDLRGELIRLEHDKATRARDDARALEAEIKKLVGKHGKAWLHQAWSGPAPESARIVWRNGFYDFWFSKGALSIEECAALTLLDYFNCTVDGTAFRKLCTSEVVHGDGDGASWIPDLLRRLGVPDAESPFTTLDKAAFFPPAEQPKHCCPFHALGSPYFDASLCGDIIEVYERAQTFARLRILPAPVVMMGQEVFLDPARFVVQPGAIHVLSAEALSPVNFAACWNFGGSPDNYVDVDAAVGVLHPLVPPILFRETEDCYHLMFDFFRNSWMVKHRQYDVPVPYIRQVDPGEAEDSGETPWMDAVEQASIAPHPKAAHEPWWGDDSPLVRELYAHRPGDADD
jgi:hypothetical protein